MRLGLFGRKDAGEGANAKAAAKAEAERIKIEVRRLLALSDQAAIAVNEILCADPACPGNETVILVMRPGAKTLAFKLAMTMAQVTAEALVEAFGERRTRL